MAKDERTGSEEEFYVGYAEGMPPATGRFLRRIVALSIGVAVFCGAAFAGLANRFPAKVFEFGTEREFIGWVRAEPVPSLFVPGPNGRSASHYLLAHGGTKFGARELVRGFEKSLVRARGTLIYRGDQTMLDITPGALERAGEGLEPTSVSEDLGRHRFVGEIVDSKCYFGVMNPATGKTHRACAARCISSGTPAILLARDRNGNPLHLLLVGARGEAVNEAVLPYVAESVALTGQVLRLDHLLVLRADLSSIERL